MATTVEQKEVISEPLSARLKLFLAVRKETKRMDDELKAQKKKLAAMEESLVEQMAIEDVQSVSVDGSLIYRTTRRFAALKEEVKDNPTLLQRSYRAIAAMGGGGLIKKTINTNSMRAWVSELAEAQEDKQVPAKLLKYVDVYEDFTLSVRDAR